MLRLIRHQSMGGVYATAGWTLGMTVVGTFLSLTLGWEAALLPLLACARRVVVLVVFQAARHARSGVRPVFALLTLAVLAYVTGDLLVTFGPFKGLADVAYGSFYLLATAATFRLRRGVQVTSGFTLDLLVMLLIPALPLVGVLSQVIPAGFAWNLEVLYPVLDLVLLSSLSAVLLARRDAPRVFEGAFVLVVALIVLGDLLYLREQLRGGGPAIGWPAWLWTAGLAGYGLSGLVALRDAARPSSVRLRWNKAGSFRTVLPAAAGVSALLTWLTLNERTAVMNVVVVGMLVLTLSLVIRQGTLLTEQGQVLARSLRVTRELRLAHQEIRRQMQTDALTGVFNRVALIERLERVVRRPAPFALIMLDLNGFKAVNDTFGHLAGDDVLRVVAGRLREGCAPHLVTRLGGDEFVVLASGEVDVHELTQRIRELVRAPVVLGDHGAVQVGTAVGWVRSTAPHPSVDALLLGADRAMYADKASGVRAADPRR
jgi:diguanylate cyclase (GGDEF)-like protein